MQTSTTRTNENTQTLPIGLNVLLGFYPVMQATVRRRRYGRTVSELNVGIQSATELYNFLQSEGYDITREQASQDFTSHMTKIYVVEAL